MLKLAIVQIVQHEQTLAQLRMLAYAFDEPFRFPADLSDKTQGHISILGPQLIECIQQIGMILTWLDGTDHQVDGALPEYAFHLGTHCAVRRYLIKVTAQVKIVEPALLCCVLPQLAAYLASNLLDNGARNGDIPIRGSGYPVKPVVEDPQDRKSTRLNSSHVRISYAVFCLKKK